MEYDVFLSYSSKDADRVAAIAGQLKEQQLRVYLDHWVMIPGERFRPELEDALLRSRSAAVFIGPAGTGPWHDGEVDVLVDLCHRKGLRLIPVLLPDASAASLPPFLTTQTRVVFKQLEDGEALYRLVCGIRGIEPGQYQPPKAVKAKHRAKAAGWSNRPASDDLIAKAVAGLADRTFIANDVTFYVGQRASVSPSTYEVTECLLKDMELLDKSPTRLAPTLDTTANYVAVARGTQVAETAYLDVLQRLSSTTPDTCQKLATLLAIVARRKAGRRRPQPQLIVTTNLDLQIERALLRTGVTFARLVQHPPPPDQNDTTWRLDLAHYEPTPAKGDAILLKGIPAPVATLDVAALDDAIEQVARKDGRRFSIDPKSGIVEVGGDEPGRPLNIADFACPILYKYHGSKDVQDSCAITSDQYLNFAAERKRFPAAITAIIASTPVVILGYGPVDSTFRHVYQNQLRGLAPGLRYMVWAAPTSEAADAFARVDLSIWQRAGTGVGTTMGLTVLDTSDQIFLDALIDQVNARIL